MTEVWVLQWNGNIEDVPAWSCPPYLVYRSADELMANYPNAQNVMFDSDLIEFETSCGKYYATPYPVHPQ